MRKAVIGLLALGLILAAGSAWAWPWDMSALGEQAADKAQPGKSRLARRQLELVEVEFPLSRAEALKGLKTEYTEVAPAELAAWLDGQVESVLIDGKRRYFEGLVKNYGYRHLPAIRRVVKRKKEGAPFYDQLADLILAPAGSGLKRPGWQLTERPVDFIGRLNIDIPRAKLPAQGKVGLWLPLPVDSPGQTAARVFSLEPAEYVRTAPRPDADLGCVYLEISLDKLEDDLAVEAGFTFRHFLRQDRVDPAKVLPYDRTTAEYQTYTRSRGNTAVTPAIAAEAKRVAAGETNPYLIAKRLFRHVIDNIRYSLTPHLTLAVLNLPESVYVHENRFGDCGAQSMYFAALCRAVGIPARTTGGYQFIMSTTGPHFWGEFYVEGYGWLPVDPTVAEAADWSGAISEQNRGRYQDWFFGNLDPYRLVIQKDVDLDTVPPVGRNIMSGDRPLLTLQSPWLACPNCRGNPLILLHEHFRLTVRPLD